MDNQKPMAQARIMTETKSSWAEMTRVFGRIGCLSFGGPAAQIALMQDELVDRHKWISQEGFLRAISLCMLLPGPEAMQLATYVGWKMRGVWGGVLAGTLFVIPGALVIFALAALYLAFGTMPITQAILLGIQCSVVAILIQALKKMVGRILAGPVALGLAVLAFLALYIFQIPFPIVILLAGLVGAFAMRPKQESKSSAGRWAWSPIFITAALWALPFAVFAALGADFLWQISAVFSQLAVMTFGGAYAVLSYLSQIAVQDAGWVSADQMIDALGLAETTPGPLILVTQFVGVLAGNSVGGWGLAIAAGFTVLWVTFVPCFLWIFAFAQHLEWLTHQPRLAAALKGVSAAVVGVIAQLALWFVLNILFGRTAPGSIPDFAALNFWAVAGIAVACLLVFWRKWAVVWVVPVMGVLGAISFVGLT